MSDSSSDKTITPQNRSEDFIANRKRRATLKTIGLVSIGGIVGCMSSSIPKLARAGSDDVLSHTIVGNGPAKIIVLHDWSVSVDSDYQMVRPLFDPEQFTIAYTDVRGYGGSKNIKGEYSVTEISRDIRALSDFLDWDSFSIVGHSMTGMAVQRVMVDMPERLVSVVATTPIPASGFPVDEETFQFFESMATNDENFKAGMSGLTSERYGNSWLSFKLSENRNTVLAPAMKAYSTMWSKTDFSSEAKGNLTPILVVYGQHDNEALRQDATGSLFKSWYPNLEEYVCHSGHYPMLESPIEYANSVISYLQKKHQLV